MKGEKRLESLHEIINEIRVNNSDMTKGKAIISLYNQKISKYNI